MRLSRVLPASADRVWQAITDDSELKAWFWPERLNPSVAVDLRPGGRYVIRADVPHMAVSGEYLEIVAPHRLVQSWQWEGDDMVSQVTITLSTTGGETELMLVHENVTTDAVASYAQGWNDCLDRLPTHLA